MLLSDDYRLNFAFGAAIFNSQVFGGYAVGWRPLRSRVDIYQTERRKAEGGIESGALPNILTTSLKVRTAARLPHLSDIGESDSQVPPGIAHLCGNLLELLTFARDAS